MQKHLSIPASPVCASELWRPDLEGPWPRLVDTYNPHWNGTKQGLVRWWRVSSSFSLSNSKRYGDIKLGHYQLQIILWHQHWRLNLRQADLMMHHSKGAGNKMFLIFEDIILIHLHKNCLKGDAIILMISLSWIWAGASGKLYFCKCFRPFKIIHFWNLWLYWEH